MFIIILVLNYIFFLFFTIFQHKDISRLLVSWTCTTMTENTRASGLKEIGDSDF